MQLSGLWWIDARRLCLSGTDEALLRGHWVAAFHASFIPLPCFFKKGCPKWFALLCSLEIRIVLSNEPKVTPHCFCRIIGWTRVRVAVLNSRLLRKAVGLWFLCCAPASFSVVFRLWRDETQFWGNCGSSSPLGLFCPCFHVNTLTT